uniref:Uncharacterized protein n=1 Tax=Romanomermis culicivorax TaxID=13658 RepID=A0A915I6Z9_ROMCU
MVEHPRKAAVTEPEADSGSNSDIGGNRRPQPLPEQLKPPRKTKPKVKLNSCNGSSEKLAGKQRCLNS